MDLGNVGIDEVAVSIMLSSMALIVAGRALDSLGIPGGRVLWDRVVNAKENWKKYTVRSFIETSHWVGMLVAMSPYGVIISFLVGTVTSMLSIISWAYLSSKIDNLLPKKAVLSVPKDLQQCPRSSVLFLLWPLAVTTYKIMEHTTQTALAIALCGYSFLIIGDTLSKLDSFSLYGAILLDRAFNVVHNWTKHPLRSTCELSVWSATIYCTHDFGFFVCIHAATAAAVGVILFNSLKLSWGRKSIEEPLATTPTGPVYKDPHNRRIRTQVESQQRIGVRGNWYDVSEFVKYHPGGDVLKEFHGKDATLQFEAFHNPRLIDRYTPVGTYAYKMTDPLEAEFLELLNTMWETAWFDVPMQWYIGKAAFCAGLFAAAVYGVLYGGESVVYNRIMPGVCLGLFWQQSGFLAHDLMHNSIFNDRKKDQAHGWFWGNVCMGLSGTWWRDEHFEHHFFTNTVVEGVGCADPQQFEQGVFMQDMMLKEFLPHEWCRFVVKLQAYTFLPIMFLIGRFGICIASYTMQHGAKEWAGIAVHWVWVIALLSNVPLYHALSIWYIAATVQGLLALQLCLSHYDKSFKEKEAVKSEWVRRQATVIKDISCPWYLDWVHGGLNYHIVHHLMPRLPRARFREAHQLIYKLLKKHDVKPDIEPFSTATGSILTHLSRLSSKA
eukprot:TRINITY_DN9036_c1_g1_i1.p1 TRINITY_DN9036_c1_g1~~TRINITY_DN9036_c1_g1_i1.p1  ORF type:complete len:699 (+),score=166.16 TRINITY_DN9036_c1_g1_i1:104-2098(+)